MVALNIDASSTLEVVGGRVAVSSTAMDASSPGGRVVVASSSPWEVTGVGLSMELIMSEVVSCEAELGEAGMLEGGLLAGGLLMAGS